MKRKLLITLLIMNLFWLGAGCSKSNTSPLPTESNLTAGMAKKSIVKGSTTQAEVMEIFGPPDLLTHKDDMQIWTYDKIRYDIESSGNYFNVLIYGRSSNRARSSSTSTMLIIYFDNNDIVKDYRMNVTRF